MNSFTTVKNLAVFLLNFLYRFVNKIFDIIIMQNQCSRHLQYVLLLLFLFFKF